MRYALNIEVKLVELPDPPEVLPAMRVGDDPLAAMAKAATGLLNAPMIHAPAFYSAPAGFDFRKQTEISAPTFQALADVIGRFQSLMDELEMQHLADDLKRNHPARRS
jgi:hypothetical protein